jgi:16S rRNA (uracil1498-N3)-methyltransferase
LSASGRHEAFFYVPAHGVSGDRATITDPGERRHLIRALRKKPGDAIQFIDGTGWIFEGRIERINPVVEIVVERRYREDRSDVEIALAPAVLKGGRLDTVIEKATELGVGSIFPLRSTRAVAGSEEMTGSGKQERWQRIALSAMKQSLGARRPEIFPTLTFEEVIGRSSLFDLALIAWEEETQNDIQQVISHRGDCRTVLALVGPEGGFTPEEIEMAREANMTTVSLGRRRLRADTASIVMITLVMAALGLMGPEG